MAKKRGGLGRGLESLFEDVSPSFEPDNAKIETLPLREIEPDPDQPRKTFDDETLAELASSIAEHGLIQPIAVRPKVSGGYLIVAGERRWRACRMAGLTEAPVVVKDVTDEQAMEIALVGNLQREDLDPVEEAMGYRQLMDKCGLTQEQAAEKLGIECIVLNAEALAGQDADALGEGVSPLFAALLTAADKLGMQYVATPHRARVETGSDGVHTVCPPAGVGADDSAALAALPQAVLARLILPLGDFAPEDVAEMAADFKV